MFSKQRFYRYAAVLLACLCGGVFSQSASGVILYSSADRNTSRPADSLGGAAWDIQGTWGYYLGTPVGSQYFLTANHFGGSTAWKFTLNGIQYTIDSTFNNGLGYVSEGDLRLWKITGTFSTWSPIYNGYNEVGQTVTLIGRGTQRGADVYDSKYNTLRGWATGTQDGVKSWGQNVLTGTSSSSTLGQLLKFSFNGSAAIANEGTYSAGDSGGGMWIQVGSQWVLAGIASTVDSPFNTTNSGSGFSAAIFDKRNLYMQDISGNWILQPNGSTEAPTAGYAARVSSHLTFLQDYVPDLVVGLAIAGDANRDGFIDGTDLAILSRNWDPGGATPTSWAQGDFNSDGKIDGTDLALLGKNWNPGGYTPSSDDIIYQGPNVPEPTSTAILIFGCLIALRRKVRRS